VPAVKPVILLINCPVLLPSVVFESAVVGFEDVLQQTPFAVIADLPSDVAIPPLVALVKVILVTGLVDNSGTVTGSVFLQL
jgi:hypothetical protein